MDILDFDHIKWQGDRLVVLDQKKLPLKKEYIECKTLEDTAKVIKDMNIRGAPLIGITAAYGVALGIKEGKNLDEIIEVLSKTRPTAVNLFWALNRMKKVLQEAGISFEVAVKEAIVIHKEDIELNLRIGENGANYLFEKLGKVNKVLTHCNTGSLATGGYGTALGIIRSLHKRNPDLEVFVDETRPYLQGARLTAYELVEDNIKHYLISDNMAAFFMKDIDAVIVGADRIASNGDTANKIGTYGLAILAKHFGKEFIVAAPNSTIDPNIESGEEIKIEFRSSDEVKKVFDIQIAPDKTQALHPAFDVTPANLITRIVTENGVFEPNKILESLD